ncbi:DUF494 family protein [Spiribacter roseus]|uniref:Protein Smg homolog n=1 Tax=Spiribacter roseus TaxID=1855875 RepID=A0ABV3RY84_9GAMM|nr:DUF494 domain-containing protein [Spiribacter roseus]AUB79200.1 hypothetical protein BBH56_08905 [Spiribacter roseus]KAF0282069.1 hypothetical protein BA900_05125 [Spiribacter roseus]KAF0283911.1 hypothetical protein BA898_02120 [Spiribacter roseus]
MKENVFEILMYLFEHYFQDAVDLDPNRTQIESDLQEAGFSDPQIFKALAWIDALAETRDLPVSAHGPAAMRIYTPAEAARLDVECRGFLLFLEQAGILTAGSRELVIDRLMDLDDDPIGLDELKWVVLMVLFSQPGQEEACASMESLLFEPPYPTKH